MSLLNELFYATAGMRGVWQDRLVASSPACDIAINVVVGTTFPEGAPSCKGAETLPRIARRYAGRDVPVSPYTHELMPSAPATVVATATITFKIIFHRFFFFSSMLYSF